MSRETNRYGKGLATQSIWSIGIQKAIHENSKPRYKRASRDLYSPRFLFSPLGTCPFEKLFVLRSLEPTPTHLISFRRPLYSSATLATLIEFSSHHIPTFRFIFSARYRTSPFVRRPSTRPVFHSAFKAPPPPGGWKRPSYINSVAECHDNNDLTAVRNSIFYRRCRCSRFFVKIGRNDSRCWDHHIAAFASKRFGFSPFSPDLTVLFLFHPVFPSGPLSPGAAPSLRYRVFLTPITRFFKSATRSRKDRGEKYRKWPRNGQRVIDNLLIISFISCRFFSLACVKN